VVVEIAFIKLSSTEPNAETASFAPLLESTEIANTEPRRVSTVALDVKNSGASEVDRCNWL
jgi:hypothetical protein